MFQAARSADFDMREIDLRENDVHMGKITLPYIILA